MFATPDLRLPSQLRGTATAAWHFASAAGYIPRTVTHPSTNRARRRVTSLMCPTSLQPGQRASTAHLYVR